MAFKRLIEIIIGPEGSLGTKFTNLRMSFNVFKTKKESTNKAEIKLYNTTLDNATKILKAEYKVIVRAGYEDEGLKSLFFGSIKYATITKNSVDRIINIEAYDGIINYQTANISISYVGGTPALNILNDLITAFGIPLANPITAPTLQYANGYSFAGKVKDALTEVTNYMGKTWTIQNEQLLILSEDEVVQRTGLRLSKDTGLVGTPTLLEDADDKQNKSDIPKRYKLKTLMFPQLVPGSEIVLNSFQASGTFKVESAQFSGDNFDGDFLTTLEVRAV